MDDQVYNEQKKENSTNEQLQEAVDRLKKQAEAREASKQAALIEVQRIAAQTSKKKSK